ncbi:MAG: hypothetical protein JW801_03035 [Bacteroidales bacterium]|nr:hypothetical protein [Bacteroidales bacterium]
MNIKKFNGYFPFLLILALLPACRQQEVKEQKSYAGLVDVRIGRFEEDLFSISPYGLADSIAYLQEKYPVFFPLFTHKIIEIGGPEHEWFIEGLIGFTTDFTIYRVSQRVKEVFPDLTKVEKELSLGFSNLEGFLPETETPEIISCISGFNQSVVTSEGLLSVSLDKYLGAGDEFYRLINPPVPEYEKRNMRPERIAADALFAWISAEFPFDKTQTNLLSNMIYEGRNLYCVKKFLPGINDTLLWGYTSEQMNFCRDHERDMWMYLAENRRIFGSEPFMITQFIKPAPFTKDFTQESPGRAAVWIGYRIVESYMKNNPKVSLEQLMAVTRYQDLLNLSKYSP